MGLKKLNNLNEVTMVNYVRKFIVIHMQLMYVYLSLQATVKLPLGDMLCSSDEAQLMRLLIRLIKAKKVIKIGEMDI